MLPDIEGVAALLLFALWIYCIFDVIATDGSVIRNLPKGMWLIIVLFIPDIGSIAWLVLGRPEKAGWRPGDTEGRRSIPRARTVGPEDSADFMARIAQRDRMLAAWAEEDQAKRLDKPEESPSSSRTEGSSGTEGSSRTEQERRRLEDWEADLARREAELSELRNPAVEVNGPPQDRPDPGG